MNCDCYLQVNRQLAEHNTELDVGSQLLRTPKMRIIPVIYIATRKVDSSKRVSAARIIAAYCPFCGMKIDDGASRTKRKAALR